MDNHPLAVKGTKSEDRWAQTKHEIWQPLPCKQITVSVSGSGKTSLLNTLAGRVPVTNKGDTLAGSVMVNGARQGDMSKVSAYVMQDDNLFALSTVYETLLFAAQLLLFGLYTASQPMASHPALLPSSGVSLFVRLQL